MDVFGFNSPVATGGALGLSASAPTKEGNLDDKFFRSLSPAETEQFRQWARDHFDPNAEPDPLWHPVVRDEWKKLGREDRE